MWSANENAVKKPAWGVKGSLFVLTFGMFLLVLSFYDWYQTRITVYRTPTFESLQVASGTIVDFTERWKSSGGAVVLKVDNGKNLTLKCGGPYREDACFHLLENGENGGAKYLGTKAVVWWQPISDKSGRLFQLAIENTPHIKYREQVKSYELEYRHGRPGSLVLAIFAAIFVVFPAIRSLVRNARRVPKN
jgi:hypothetical protein